MEPVQQIADSLRNEIAGLEPGDRLPSENDLVRRFGVTRTTVRRALERLEARFLVRRVQGAGTFVHRRIDYVVSPDGAPSLHRIVESAGSTARTFLIDVDEREAPEDIRGFLGSSEGDPCTRLVRLAYIDDHVATCAEEWIAPRVLADLDVSLRAIESLSEVLIGTRRDPVRAWSRVATDFAPAPIAARLEIGDATPTWCLETLTRDGEGGPALMFSRSWLRQDRVRVVVRFGDA
ncbi:GntR family transcriptional regulator [Microbacterium karelineae]|uniref:GntR family transcriptional regulator n=1 Tax=Microbacterium karelineae TaxID=2654283 RepID=UPI0012E9B124|nr:GntR family transcriptional regulator [Microbacterium karelineae]